MVDSLLNRVTHVEGARYVAPEVSYLFDKIVNVVFVGPPNAGDRGWVLVDAGLPGSAASIIAAAEQLFGTRARPAAIVLTHGHIDHIGAIHALMDAWDVRVYAHELELPYLTGRSSYPPPDPFVGGGTVSLLSAFIPRSPINLDSRVSPLPEDGSVPGLTGWRWIATPGHSPGHVSFIRDLDRTLIAGDAFTTTKQESLRAVLAQRAEVHGPPMYFTTDWDAARDSVRRLEEYAPSAVIAGHGPPLCGPDLQVALHELSVHFDERSRPSRGRYRDVPARADATGVTSVPPPLVSAKAVLVTALAVGSAVALAVALSTRRGGATSAVATHPDLVDPDHMVRVTVADDRVAAGAALATADGGYDGDTTYETTAL